MAEAHSYTEMDNLMFIDEEKDNEQEKEKRHESKHNGKITSILKRSNTLGRSRRMKNKNVSVCTQTFGVKRYKYAAKVSGGDRICLETCLYGGLGYSQETVRCCLCAHWYHIDCVNLPSQEAVGAWPCYHCRTLSDDLRSLQDRVDNMNCVLMTILRGHQTQIDAAQATINTMQAKFQLLTEALLPSLTDADVTNDDDEDEKDTGTGSCLIKGCSMM